MTENNEHLVSDTEKDKKIRQRKELSLELSESAEQFPFPGLRESAYELLKEADTYANSDYVTPIDVLLELLSQQGMVVDSGPQLEETDKKPSTITVRPAKTEAGLYGENLLHIKNLKEVENMDTRLRELLSLAHE
jgi:hypothetical protein